MNAISAHIPRYVLLDGNEPLGPKLSSHDGQVHEAVYGFSGKESYDRFVAISELPLTPFPLVKRYLKNQIIDSASTIHLVVIDATGPQEAHVNAVTMDAVVEAQEQKVNHVCIAFRLRLDAAAKAYRVESPSSDSDTTSRPVETQST